MQARCTTKCQFKGIIWNPGDVYEWHKAEDNPCKHFELLPGNTMLGKDIIEPEPAQAQEQQKPKEPEDELFGSMSVRDLRAECEQRNLDSEGNKKTLIQRLREAMKSE